MISFVIKESMINEALIPKRPEDGCPPGTFDSPNTCYCEDHCSWESCWLLDPPQNCLSNVANESVWAWNTKTDVWVVQSNYLN